MKVWFSINFHDRDGDVYDKCLLLHLGETLETTLRFGSIRELDDFVTNVGGMMQEIREANADRPEHEQVPEVPDHE